MCERFLRNDFFFCFFIEIFTCVLYAVFHHSDAVIQHVNLMEKLCERDGKGERENDI